MVLEGFSTLKGRKVRDQVVPPIGGVNRGELIEFLADISGRLRTSGTLRLSAKHYAAYGGSPVERTIALGFATDLQMSIRICALSL